MGSGVGWYIDMALNKKIIGVFPGGLVVKNPPVSARNAADAGSVSGLGRSPGGGNGSPPQYSCLENSMGRQA